MNIVFKNNGVIDHRAIKTFGVSVKEIENPIGFFGTGLKYAIAILMRENCTLELITDGQVYKFEKKIFSMRGKDFEGIVMNGEELPFTTELGKNWNLWQAFRELYCNCMDEGGRVYESSEDESYELCQTVFRVTGQKFINEFINKDEIILSIDPALKITSGDCDIYDIPSKSIFYRGIRVLDLPRASMYTYNINSYITLTEDRTVRDNSQAMSKVSSSISKLTNRNLIRRALTSTRDFIEHDFDYTHLKYFDQASEEFYQVLSTEYKKNNDALNRSAKEVLLKRMHKYASKHYETSELTLVERKQLARSKTILSSVYKDFADYKILVVKTLGQETMALADAEEQTIVISKRSFELGTKFLVSTLLEEYFHLKTGYTDHSRQLQTYLFDSICSLVESHVIMEPI